MRLRGMVFYHISGAPGELRMCLLLLHGKLKQIHGNLFHFYCGISNYGLVFRKTEHRACPPYKMANIVILEYLFQYKPLL